MQAQHQTEAGGPLSRHTVLSARHTTEKTGFSIATLWRKVAAKEFPKPIQLGPNRVGWIESEIDAWITARIAERDGRAA